MDPLDELIEHNGRKMSARDWLTTNRVRVATFHERRRKGCEGWGWYVLH